MTTRIDYEKARPVKGEIEQIDERDRPRARDAQKKRIAQAVAKGVNKRRRDAANEAARIVALANGEVFAPSVVRRDSKSTPTSTPDQPPAHAPQSSEEIPRAQACSDAKLGAERSYALKTPQGEHPRFPGRPANWRPNRAQRAKLRRMGLL